jgi:hypothetical protein
VLRFPFIAIVNNSTLFSVRSTRESNGLFATTSPAHCQTLFANEPEKLLMVQHHAPHAATGCAGVGSRTDGVPSPTLQPVAQIGEGHSAPFG